MSEVASFWADGKLFYATNKWLGEQVGLKTEGTENYPDGAAPIVRRLAVKGWLESRPMTHSKLGELLAEAGQLNGSPWTKKKTHKNRLLVPTEPDLWRKPKPAEPEDDYDPRFDDELEDGPEDEPEDFDCYAEDDSW